MQRTDVVPREQVLSEVAAWLKERHGIVMVGGLGFENAYALAMTKKRAAEAGISSIARPCAPCASAVDCRRL